MPSVQITVEIDERGVVTGFRQIGAEGERMRSGLERTGRGSNVVFNTMKRDQREAAEAAQLLAGRIGVQLPRSVSQFLSRLPAVQSALRAAFSGAIIGTLIVALAQATLAVHEFYEEFISGEARRRRALEEEGKAASSLAVDTEKFVRQKRLEAATATAGDLKKLELETAAALAEIRRKQFGQARVDDIKRINAQIEAAEQASAAKRVLILRGMRDETIRIENEARLAGLRGGDLIEEKARIEIQTQETLYKRGGLLREDFLRREAALIQKSKEEWGEYYAELQAQGRIFNLQGALSFASGFEALERQRDLDIAQAEEYERKNRILTNRVALAWEAYYARREELSRQVSEETIRIEEDAALAVVPEWQRSYAGIAVAAQQRFRQIAEELRRSEITHGDAARRTAAVWIEASARMRDQLAGDLERAFDMITSGRLGDFVLAQFKRIVFQMVATWLLGMRQIQSATAGGFGLSGGAGGGGGGFLGALGSLFGLGGSRIGPGGTAPFNPNAGIGGGLSLVSGLPLSGSAGTASFGPDSFGSPLSAGGGFGAGAVLPAGAAAGTLARTGGRFGGGNLAQLLLLGGLGGASAIGFGSPLRGAASGALLGAAGLAGFSLFAGGNIAASLSFLFGGPVGWTILGLSALVGALFGFLGGRRRHKQRVQLLQQLDRQIQQLKDAYTLHQIDYLSAIGQLEQMRAQYTEQSRRLGGRGEQIAAHVDAAIRWFNDQEAERQRRLAVAFGPGQFHRGGEITPASAGLSGTIGPLGTAINPMGAAVRRIPANLSYHEGGEVGIKALLGEGVVSRRGMRTLGRSGLDAINRGQIPAGGTIVINGPLIHADSLDAAWWRSEGQELVVSTLRRAMGEGAL